MPTSKKSGSKPTATKTTTVKTASISARVPAASGWTLKDKIIAIQVVLLTLCAFAVGLLYGKVSVYEKNGGTALNQPSAIDPNTAPTEEKTQLSDDEWKAITSDPMAVKGDKNAPVTIVEFTDFQCPYCSRYFEDTYGQIMSDYVDTGKVKYISRDLPLKDLHPNAEGAANAARCAADQNKFFEMHDALFSNQAAWSELADPKPEFVKAATSIGLNSSTFTSCYDSNKHQQAIADDLNLASQVGASGTPTFFINGTKLVGAQPYVAFKQAIDLALEQ